LNKIVIPTKSKGKYDLAYAKFDAWCKDKNVNHINEKVLLAYFEGKNSTLWSLSSMLRTELSLKRNVDNKKFTGLLAFLKRHFKNYQPIRSQMS